MTDSSSDKPPLRRDTRLVHAGRLRSEWCETSEAMFLTSGYVYPDAATAAARMAGEEPGYVYSRYANPTVRMLETRLADLERAQACLCTASGMAAIAASILAPCRSGDRIVAAKALFGSCRWIVENLLPQYGMEIELVPGEDLDAWERALSRPARRVLVETPANPLLGAIDMRAVADMAHAAGAELIVDNVFATPLHQQPLQQGADWVVYSTTKHIDGQGRVLGGAVLGPRDAMDEIFDPYLRHTGPALSPFNAWVLLKGLETLSLRVERQAATAAALADLAAEHPAVADVRYPGREDHPDRATHRKQMQGGGSLIALSLKGGRAGAFAFLDSLELIAISNNLGDAKTLATHPATTTHRVLSDKDKAEIGLDESWIRMSAGLEDVEDLRADLSRALEAAAAI